MMNDSLKERKYIKYFTFILMLSIITLLLGACSGKTPGKNEGQVKPPAKQQEWKLPIPIPKGEFYKVSGWLSDNEILYITNLEQASNLYQYNLETGKSKLLYQSAHPIATVEISPSKRYLLIQSAPSTYQGLVTITDLSGKELMKQSYTAYELDYEWNPYNDGEVLIAKFNQDWTYDMHLLDIKNTTSKVVELPQPFIKWTGKEEVAFLNYDEEKSELFAPLIEKKLSMKDEKTLFSSVYQFSAYRNMLMTITVNNDDPSKAEYSFYSKEKNQIYHFSIPQLSKFSDWLVPFYDYNEKKGQFITLSPVESGDVDSYSKGFDLIKYDLKKARNKLILKGLKNQPLEFSPSGEACLYGNNFENLINLNKKIIEDLVKE